MTEDNIAVLISLLNRCKIAADGLAKDHKIARTNEEIVERIRLESGKWCPCCSSDKIWPQYNESEQRKELLNLIEMIASYRRG